MLSIIIPTLNEEKYLPKLLGSIKRQSFKDYEIIVSDADSKDKTKSIAKEWSKSMDIKYTSSKGKKSPAAQRNSGVKKAKFNRLLFLDADIMLPKNFLLDSLNEIKERRLDIAGCYIKPLSSKLTDKLSHKSVNFYMWLHQYRKYPIATGQCLFSTKDIHSKIHGFDETIKICEDYDYVKRSRHYGKFRMLNKSVHVSVRRFEKNGRLRMIAKYLAIEYSRIRHGPIRQEKFDYSFGEH